SIKKVNIKTNTMNIIKSSLLLVPFALFSCKSQTDTALILERSEKQLTELRVLSMKEHKNPRSINPDGSIRWVEPPYDWTEGFFPGTCWMHYERTKDEKWKEAAIAIQDLYKQHKDLTNDHDLGFIFNNSFGKAYRITGEDRYKQVLIDASRSLITRFNKNVGCIQSWDVIGNWQAERGWKFPVIIDNL